MVKTTLRWALSADLSPHNRVRLSGSVVGVAGTGDRPALSFPRFQQIAFSLGVGEYYSDFPVASAFWFIFVFRLLNVYLSQGVRCIAVPFKILFKYVGVCLELGPIIDGCEPLCGCWDWTQDLWKSSWCSQPLSYLFSPSEMCFWGSDRHTDGLEGLVVQEPQSRRWLGVFGLLWVDLESRRGFLCVFCQKRLYLLHLLRLLCLSVQL